ncbi:hypothetical protein WG906_08705 [Pedobacter sp. P351]|uniref:hypothetical protein n=1 Tax=Pedobacter superstes TaxID=3133441 RepID=UPI003096FE1C
MIIRVSFYLILVISPPITLSQTLDNAELKRMYEEDQSSRNVSGIDWNQLSKDDKQRQQRLQELIAADQLITGKDFYRSAMLFQHGEDSIAYGMAIKHMRKAILLDSTISKWLLAAAIDRELMSRAQAQIYGTQYVKNGTFNAKWKRYRIDTTKVTDEERLYYGVETLNEQKEKERSMNLASVTDFNQFSSSIESTILLIQTEKEKGVEGTYNVSENTINRFGYELLASGKTDEALKVFRVNTKLYPLAFNTWDSLGECLLRMKRSEEGMAAYKRSLELNPKNGNAIKVLSTQK